LADTTNDSLKRIVKHKDVKLFIMKKSGKIDYRFKRELLSLNNPFLNFAKKIKNFDGHNFVVEWQMGGNDKKGVFGKQVYGMTV